jgi:peptidoglycan/LPS O-acetylase OafA/YrhL
MLTQEGLTAKPLTAARKPFFANLDFLRVVAFAMVFGLHTQLASTLGMLSTNKYYHQLLHLLTDGGLGVSFFFLLSGFLITYLLLNEVAHTGKIHLRHFYMRRFLRIWPLYYVVLMIGFWFYPGLKTLLGIDSSLSNQAPWYWTFLSNFDSIYLEHHNLAGTSAMMVNITWSVAIEEQFYLVWPLLFMLVPRRCYPAIFCSVITTSTLFRYFHRMDHATMYFHTLSVASDLAIGGMCAWCCLNKPVLRNWLQHASTPVIAGIYLVGFSELLFRDALYATPTAQVFARLAHGLFFAFIILEQNYADHSFVKLSRFRRISSLGKYTYGLYLLHPLAIQATDLLMRSVRLTAGTLFSGLFYAASSLVIALVLGILSYKFLETPFLRLKHRFA